MKTALLLLLTVVSPVVAEEPPKNDLAGIEFLVGHWRSGDGQVSDTGGSSKGSSVITLEANGHALLRRDHTDLFDTKGKTSGGFDQIMLIYPEGSTLHADYSDGQHVIHYTSASVVPGKSVAFSCAPQSGSPSFRLTYEAQSADVVKITFGAIPPGQTEFHPIASGIMKKGG